VHPKGPYVHVVKRGIPPTEAEQKSNEPKDEFDMVGKNRVISLWKTGAVHTI